MAQSNIPNPQSQPQTLGQLIDGITSRVGIARLKVGSGLLSLLEDVSQTTTRATYDVLKALKSKDIDSTEGVALQRIGLEEGVPQLGPLAASTRVTIIDSRYQRIASNLYHGQPAPIVGSMSVYVDKSPAFAAAPASGTVYIGRGTDQQEGPLVYTSKTDSGNYWTINLSTPTAVFHAQGEEVVVGQGGDREVVQGQTVSTPAGALSIPVKYTVLVGGVIPDGEVEVSNVQVVCTTPGAIGNVPKGAISDFGGAPPFSGASVTNPNQVTNGRDAMSAKEHRERIKAKRKSRERATDLAIKEAAINVKSPDEEKTVLSSSLVRKTGGPSILYIDDGNGYEPIYEGVGYEVLRDPATGGEKEFSTIRSPIVLACVESGNSAPFRIGNGTTLLVETGFNLPQTHTFDTAVFSEPQSASAYDIVSSINSNTSLQFRARVSSNGTKFTIFPKDEIGTIKVSGGTANVIFGLPTTRTYTALLYKNDRFLNFFQYSLDRSTGELILAEQLLSGDKLTLGSVWNKAFLETNPISGLTLTSDVDLWFVVDGNTTVMDSGKDTVGSLTVAIAKSTPSCLHLSIQNSNNFSSNVGVGQSILLYKTDNNSLPDALVGSWKIIEKPADNKIVIEYPSMKSARKMAAAVNITGTDKILVCGGLCSQNTGALNSVELYNTTTGAWTSATPMNTARYGHTATALANGKVVVVGGAGVNGQALNSIEVYDPVANTWTDGASFVNGKFQHAAMLLSNGNVLVTGGLTGAYGSQTATNDGFEYNPTANTLVNSAGFAGARFAHTLIALPSGEPFMIGGMGSLSDPLSRLLTVNTYATSSHSWSALADVPEDTTTTYYRNYTAATSGTTTVVAVADESFYTYDISGNSWNSEGAIAKTPEFSVTQKIYNGTSVSQYDYTGDYRYFGRTNKLVKTANGIIIMPFAELSDSSTGPSRKHAHLYYKVSDGHWHTTGGSDLTVAGCKSHFTSLGVAGSGHEDEVAIIGGQSSDRATSGGEDAISATIDIIDYNSGLMEYLCPVTGTYTGSQGWAIYATQRHTSKLSVDKDLITGNNYLASAVVDGISLEGALAKTYKTSKIRISTNDNDGDIIELGPEFGSTNSETLERSGVCLAGTAKSERTEIDIPSNFNLYQIGSIEGATLRIPSILTSGIGGVVFNNGSTPETLNKAGFLPLNGTICGTTRKNFWEDRLVYVSAITPILPINWGGGTQTDALSAKEYGNFKNEIARIGSWSAVGSIPAITGIANIADSTLIGVTSTVTLSPNQPFYCGTPYRFNAEETLSVIVDNNNTSGVFSVPMSRKLKSTDTTYTTQVTLSDAENSNQSLAGKFGTEYSFNNFNVSMKARNKLGNILYRFWRHGAEGENYAVRYMYPTVADAELSVTVDHGWRAYAALTQGLTQKSFVNINLGSGSEYTESALTATTRVAIQQTAVSNNVSTVGILVGMQVTAAERTSIGGTTRLRVSYPETDMSSVFQVGDFIRFDAVTSTPTTLMSGQTRITAVSSITGQIQDLTIAAGSLDDGTSALPTATDPGTVSLDAGAISKIFFDETITAGDILVLKSPLHYAGRAIRITDIGDSHQFLKGRVLTSTSETDPLYIDTIQDPANIVVFEKPSQTESDIVTAVNALISEENSTCPISATLIGSGSSVIALASWDTNTAWDSSVALLDGFNVIQTAVQPATINDDYEFVFKRLPASELATDSDWINEEVYISPAYASDVVKWLKTPCVTGLWSQADISTADGGTSVQITSKTLGKSSSIQVSGAGANQATASVIGGSYIPTNAFPSFVTTIDRSSATGLSGGDIVKITNTVKLQKNYFNSSGVTVTSISTDGVWTFSGTIQDGGSPFGINRPFNVPVSLTGSIEKAGNFTLIKVSSNFFGNQAFPMTYEPGDFVYIGTPTYSQQLDWSEFDSLLSNVSNANKGIFKIINITHNGSVIWIENPITVEEKCVMDFGFVSWNSIVPGDTLIAPDDRFGVNNRGAWTVTSVGSTSDNEPFFQSNVIKVSVASKKPQAFSGSETMNFSSVHVMEGTPQAFYKKILGISPNQANGSLVDLKLSDMGNRTTSCNDHTLISSSAGSIVSSTCKLNFPVTAQVGVDAYSYHTGLIGEVKKVIYGDDSDRQTYPGYVANGARILFDGPIIRRIQKSFAVKAIGDPDEELADNIRSMIAGVINSNPTGQNISVSDLIAAANGVDGVETIKPLFDESEVIVNAGEKAKVLKLKDIGIVFVG